MKDREEMAWELFLVMLSNPEVLDELHRSPAPSDTRKRMFDFAYTTTYDYVRFLNGDL